MVHSNSLRKLTQFRSPEGIAELRLTYQYKLENLGLVRIYIGQRS